MEQHGQHVPPRLLAVAGSLLGAPLYTASRNDIIEAAAGIQRNDIIEAAACIQSRTEQAVCIAGSQKRPPTPMTRRRRGANRGSLTGLKSAELRSAELRSAELRSAELRSAELRSNKGSYPCTVDTGNEGGAVIGKGTGAAGEEGKSSEGQSSSARENNADDASSEAPKAQGMFRVLTNLVTIVKTQKKVKPSRWKCGDVLVTEDLRRWKLINKEQGGDKHKESPPEKRDDTKQAKFSRKGGSGRRKRDEGTEQDEVLKNEDANGPTPRSANEEGGLDNSDDVFNLIAISPARSCKRSEKSSKETQVPEEASTMLGGTNLRRSSGKSGSETLMKQSLTQERETLLRKIAAHNLHAKKDPWMLKIKFSRNVHEIRVCREILQNVKPHPNLSNVLYAEYGSESSRNKSYVITECRRTNSLETVRRQKAAALMGVSQERPPWSEKQAENYFSQIVTALAQLHMAGIAHGNINPTTVGVTQDGQVKILDYRFATDAISKEIPDALRNASEYAEYLAPEVTRGCSPTAAADVYSCGALLYYLLTGTAPQQELLQEAVRGSSQLPERAVELLEAMLRDRPADRPMIRECFGALFSTTPPEPQKKVAQRNSLTARWNKMLQRDQRLESPGRKMTV